MGRRRGREEGGGRGKGRAAGAVGRSVVAAALFRADDGQPGQEGGGVRQRHGGKRPAGKPWPQARAGMCEWRAGPRRSGLYPRALGPPGPRGAGQRFRHSRAWGVSGPSPVLVSPSLPPPQLRVRAAGRADARGGSSLLPGAGSAPQWV